MSLTPHQAFQLTLATAGKKIGALVGGPGTGKTYTAARYMLEADGDFLCCAPTGKAAVRLAESLQTAGVPSPYVRTIHSLLRPTVAGGRWEFFHDRSNPLECSHLLVDESSMIDSALMADLLDAVPACGKVLFLGDINQLSPVGHGAPLRDMLGVIPHGTLTEVQRNAGNIVESCHAMQHGKDWGPGGNLENLTLVSPQQLVQDFASTMKQMGIGYEDAQIVVPMNEKSDYSRVALNLELQRQLNPNTDRVAGFSVGDKVINTRNGWLLTSGPTSEDANRDSTGKVYVANGEIGIVKKLNQKSIVIELPTPLRTVNAPLNDDGDCSWQLGYAITVHRAQGSEWPLVFVVLDEAAMRMCDRSWIYTAISRAKERCVLVGPMSLAYAMAKRNRIDHRKTFLRELLHA